MLLATNRSHALYSCTVAYRGGLGFGEFKPPSQNSEVLTKLSQIPSSVENTSVTTLDIPKVWQSRTGLQIEQNPWPGGYRPQIPVFSALCPQLNFLKPPPPPNKIPGYATALVLFLLTSNFELCHVLYWTYRLVILSHAVHCRLACRSRTPRQL
jgi:hypothetical protein